MPAQAADRNLLFGILALQMDFITRDGLIGAMGGWVLEKHRPLGEILVEKKALDPKLRALLEPMVDAHIERHDGNPARSLASLSSIESATDALRHSLVDSEVLDSLETLASDRVEDPYETHAGTGFETPPPGVRYRKVRDHAQGGLGVVYVAHDGELNREVALKEIQDRHADDPEKRARFLIEAEVTGGLEHPGIVPVYGLGSYHDGRPFYAMRFIRGASLKDAIARFHADESLRSDPGARALALQKLLRRFLDVCNAIAYAHSRGVLHRDLKPDNVMVGKYGETLVVDWGLAKTTGQAGDASETALPEATLSPASSGGSHETLPGSVIGTPGYMSPEQAAGRLDLLGPTSDVYSLGATLYTLLTGVVPFADKDLHQLLRKVENGQFSRPREIAPWLDPALEAVCLKAMALKPAHRYPSPRTLAEDLELWVANEPVTCWREPVARRMRRWFDRNRTLVSAAVSLLATAVVALAIAVVLIDGEKSKATIAGELAKESAKKEAAAATLARELAQKEAASATLAKSEEEKAKKAAAQVLGVIEVLVKAFQETDPIGLESMGLGIGSGSERTLSAPKILDRSSQLVEKTLGDDPLAQATLMDTIGDVYRSMGKLDESEKSLQVSLKIRSAKLPADDPDLSTTFIHLGWLKQDQGQFDEAERLFQEVIQRQTAKVGALSRLTIQARIHLATLWLFEDDFAKAETAFRELVDQLARIRGEDDRDLALARLGLSASLFGVNNYVPAVIQGKKAFTVLLGKAEAKPVVQAIDKFQQAYALKQLKMYRQAENLYRESLEIARGYLGADHPYCCFMLYEIGEVLELKGDDAKAEASYQECLALVRRSVGLRHPKTKLLVYSLGKLLVKTGHHEDAKKLVAELLEARRQAYGRDHVWVADAQVLCAEIANLQGNSQEAVELLKQALAIYRNSRGRYPSLLTSCLNSLAILYLNNGSPQEAEKLLREALPLVRRQFGPSNSNVGLILDNLARTLIAQDKDGDEVDQLYAEAVPMLTSPLNLIPNSRLFVQENSSYADYRRGRFERAEESARGALNDSRQVFRDNPAQQARYSIKLAGVLVARGKLQQAIPLLEEAIALNRKASVKGSVDLINSIGLLALAKAALGDFSGSRDTVERMLGDFESTNDPGQLEKLTWVVSRFSGTVRDVNRLESLARRVLEAKPNDDSHRITGSAALLRAGRFDEVVRRLEDLRRERKQDFLYGDFFLAIAYQNLGQFDQAKAARARTASWMDRPSKFTRAWDLQLTLMLLRREVDQLVRVSPEVLPVDVFTPGQE